MPVLLIIKRTISAPPLEVTNVRIIVLWVQCSTDGDKFHGFSKSWSARTRKLLCCVHMSVSLVFLIVALLYHLAYSFTQTNFIVRTRFHNPKVMYSIQNLYHSP